MTFEPPWILAPAFLEQLTDSGLDPDHAVLTIREIIRSTKRMPRRALAPGPAEPPAVRYALPEIERLYHPLDAGTLDIASSLIHAIGKRFGVPYAQPEDIWARVEFWAADVKRLFPPISIETPRFRNASDAPLVAIGVAGVEKGRFASSLQAAKALGPKASGPDMDQNIDRLRKAIAKEVAKHRQR